jgi:hypothetical protein
LLKQQCAHVPSFQFKHVLYSKSCDEHYILLPICDVIFRWWWEGRSLSYMRRNKTTPFFPAPSTLSCMQIRQCNGCTEKTVWSACPTESNSLIGRHNTNLISACSVHQNLQGMHRATPTSPHR